MMSHSAEEKWSNLHKNLDTRRKIAKGAHRLSSDASLELRHLSILDAKTHKQSSRSPESGMVHPPASESDEPDANRGHRDYRSLPGNQGAYAVRRPEGDTVHFLMITFWESGEAPSFAGDDISVAKYYDFDRL
jgi:hypothetical protein